jgi:hypothetical protein
MEKHLLVVGALLVVLLFAVAPARAASILEPFDAEEGYVPGSALSANYWTQADDTTGVLDIEDIGGEHGLVVKMTVNEPIGGTSFPTVGATTEPNWGGPQRANSQLWFSVDIEKGTTDGMTSLNSFIWSMQFAKANGAELFLLQGGFGTVRLRSVGNVTFNSTIPDSGNPALASATFNLNDGWNQVAVLSDLSVDPLSTDPNTFLYLNRVQVASLHVNNDGPLGIESAANVPNQVSISRLSRNPAMENWVGSMRFDNILTADGRPGDANHDHNVDIFDINLISANWGSPGGPDGDVNGDGNVDIFDINLVSANWAPAPTSGGSTAVPEPAAWVLLSLAGLAVLGRWRRRR